MTARRNPIFATRLAAVAWKTAASGRQSSISVSWNASQCANCAALFWPQVNRRWFHPVIALAKRLRHEGPVWRSVGASNRFTKGGLG